MTEGPTEEEWLRARDEIQRRRLEMTHDAATGYPSLLSVDGTDLLVPPQWLPPRPLALDRVDLEWSTARLRPAVIGADPVTAGVRPVRADGRRYSTYAEAIGELAPPAMFEDRPTYRLLNADLAGKTPKLTFSRGMYFDQMNVGESAAHEYLIGGNTLRSAIGDPTDPARRPVAVAISTLTVRLDRGTGEATFIMHWRDPGKVAHAGGLYQVMPVGVFQPSGTAPGNEANDFDLWRGMVREYNEELLGGSEDYGSDVAPIDYAMLPVYATLTAAVDAGTVRPYTLGMGVDPLTLATDLLTVVVIEAPVFDQAFRDLVDGNAEGSVLSSIPGATGAVGIPFTETNIDRFARDEPIQAAGAALLRLTWRHRAALLAEAVP